MGKTESQYLWVEGGEPVFVGPVVESLCIFVFPELLLDVLIDSLEVVLRSDVDLESDNEESLGIGQAWSTLR